MTAASRASSTLSLFARFVGRQIGIHFAAERLPELGQRMAALATRAGCPDAEKYLLQIMSEPLSRERLDLLVSTLAIGETYFLRDPKSYQVLADHLLPELITARRGAGREIRIWSAGCSTGEEPYSIAILLSRAIPDLQNWKLTLLGTDINREALERARRGLYREWSFRNAPVWLSDYFTRRSDGRYQIAPAIREMVRFEELNLVEQGFRQPGDAAPFDIIFCRNVMLYFDQQHIAHTMARFHDLLSTGGWLFVSPSEINHTLREGFAVASYDGAFVLTKMAPGAPQAALAAAPASPVRRKAGPTLASAPPPLPSQLPPAATGAGAPELGWYRAPAVPVSQESQRRPHRNPARHDKGPSLRGWSETAARAPAESSGSDAETGGTAPRAGEESRPRHEEAVELYRTGRYAEAAEAALATLSAGKDDADALALSARAYANIGRFDEARACCERAIACDRLRAADHYLLSIIMEQLGDSAAALKSLKDALFVDHDYLLAYFALGNLYRQNGDATEARRNYATALRLLEKRHPHEVLPEAGDMTAGRLAEMIKAGTRD